MSTCGYCNQEMLDLNTKGCTAKVPHPNRRGEIRPPIPYGYELRYALLTTNPVGTPEDRVLLYRAECLEKPCHDCGVVYGECHHPGCDVEECPWCGKQSIGCDCHPNSREALG